MTKNKLDQTLYDLIGGALPSPKQAASNFVSANNITEYIWIGVILVVLFFFGPLLYEAGKSIYDVLKAGEDLLGDATKAVAKGIECATYCYGSKTPTVTCTKSELDKAKKSFTGVGGFAVCTECDKPCIIPPGCNCKAWDIFGILSSIFIGLFGLAALRREAKKKAPGGKDDEDGKSDQQDAKDDGELIDDLQGDGEKPDGLDDVADEIEKDPKGDKAQRADAANKKSKAAELERKAESDASVKAEADAAKADAEKADAASRENDDGGSGGDDDSGGDDSGGDDDSGGGDDPPPEAPHGE
jgi:hypothetical protein